MGHHHPRPQTGKKSGVFFSFSLSVSVFALSPCVCVNRKCIRVVQPLRDDDDNGNQAKHTRQKRKGEKKTKTNPVVIRERESWPHATVTHQFLSLVNFVVYKSLCDCFFFVGRIPVTLITRRRKKEKVKSTCFRKTANCFSHSEKWNSLDLHQRYGNNCGMRRNHFKITSTGLKQTIFISLLNFHDGSHREKRERVTCRYVFRRKHSSPLTNPL